MANIEEYKRQHIDIFELVNKMMNLLDDSKFTNNVTKISTLLSDLNDILEIHFVGELYPLLDGLYDSKPSRVKKSRN